MEIMDKTDISNNKKKLAASFNTIRSKTEELCAPLEIEDYIPQPIMDVSPPRWNLAHTTWFFEQFILKGFQKGYIDFHPKYNFLFNSYYENVGERWERHKRGHLSRPTVKEIFDFRHHVTEKVLNLIPEIEDKDWTQFSSLMTLGINHEQQHQELLMTDLKYILSINPLHPVYNSKNPYAKNFNKEPNTTYAALDGGLIEVGHTGNSFAFDNEMPAHKVFVNPFKIRKSLVTNQEYLEFIEAGGYTDFKYWLSEGWTWVNENQIKAPLYWKKIDNEWHEMTLNGLQKVVPNAPVTHVSYYEAEAFATWLGKRLPSEFEWTYTVEMLKLKPVTGKFLNSNNFHPMPVLEGNDNFQFFGDAWEWTNSAYLPYPGYKQVKGAIGEYNGKFMINQMVLKGGSCVTPNNHIRLSYRNFWHPDKQFQFTGIRLVDN